MYLEPTVKWRDCGWLVSYPSQARYLNVSTLAELDCLVVDVGRRVGCNCRNGSCVHESVCHM